MKVVAIVQARMSSLRLPGKVLLPLAGKPVLAHVIDRLRTCNKLHDVVLATSVKSEDDSIEQWCKANNVNCFRGSLEDVLDRYYQAATKYKAEAVVRITADCPMIDPMIVDEVVEGFLAGDFDAYSLAGEFPDGLDCQVFAYSAIERAWHEAKLPSEREHVGPYIEKSHPEYFKTGGLEKFSELSHHRWTLDEPRDYEFLQAVFARLYKQGFLFRSSEILALMEREPDLMQINCGIIRNEGYLKSLQAEQR
jgi:spore coat polysaccharide biosynthesis protein SpsF